MSPFLDGALALPGGLLLVLCLTAKYVAPSIRATLGRAIYQLARRQREAVTALQRHLRHPLLDQLAKLTALTVSVEFYLLSLPPLVWLNGRVGSLAAMSICQCMAVSTYMTCVLKDIISCPRPYMLSEHERKQKQKQKQQQQHAANQAPAPPAAVVTASAITGVADGSDVMYDSASSRGRAPAPPRLDTAAPPSTPATSAAAAAAAPSSPSPSPLSPFSPAVEKLEDPYRGEIEFGPPSMHTWCALVLPAYAAAVAEQLGVLTAAQCTAVTAGAVFWAAWVALTRLYLGVHYPVDLGLGALGGAAVWGLWRRIGLAQLAAVGARVAVSGAAGAAVSEPAGELPVWASWFGFDVGRDALGAAAVLLLYLTALGTYPLPASHTTSFEYAVIFLGAAYGGLIGTNPGYSLVLPLLQRPAAALFGGVDPAAQGAAGGSPTVADALAEAAPAVLRHPAGVALLGFAVVAAVKLVSKAVLSELLPRVLRLAPLRLRLLWQPPVHPEGCVTAAAAAPPAATAAKDGGDASAKPSASSSGDGVLMKTPTLPYDVDFIRKFVNYLLTVYMVQEFRHVAAVLLGAPLEQ